ncbi:MAG: hypothetical protein QM731_10375 [Chitinophagaceae bacterium]
MKTNKATHNRPGEDRVIDAPYVITSINDRITQLKNEEAWKSNDRNGITLFKTEGHTVVLSCFHGGTLLKHNDADSIVTIQLLQGKIKFKPGTEVVDLTAPSIINLHPNVHHEIEMIGDTALLFMNSTKS